jgi:carboxyl-terminal processing protease
LKYNNSRFTIVLPLVISLSLITGILVEKYVFSIHNRGERVVLNSKLNLVLDYIQNEYVDSVSKNDIVESVIPFVLENLDPHSMYIPASDFNEVNDPLEGEFEGIGVQFNVQKDTIFIVQVIAGGPSEKVNLRAGDRIVKINDSLVAGIGISSNNVVKMLKGPKGTKVNISVARNNVSELLDFTIIRDKIPLYSVDVSYMPSNDIGYLKLSKFSMTTIEEFNNHISKLKKEGMTKLILDLRGNGGGILNAAIQLANDFLPAGNVITYTEGKAYPRKYYYSDKRGICKNIELAILIDEGSASASEVLSGAIQDNDRGIIIGRRSFGKGLVMDQRMFNDGSAIRLTVSRYYSPTGRCIQKSYDSGKDDYLHEIEQRYLNGEFSNIDSLNMPDSLKFTTPKGKIVYGGGGILPDIFVPIDTIGLSPYFSAIVNKGLIYEYAFDYADKNRVKLSKFKTVNDLIVYLKEQDISSQFFNYAKNNGNKPDESQINISNSLINSRIEAYIVRNIFDDQGFYSVLLKSDKAFLKALEVLNDGIGTF